jgi:hypothetical protein
MGDRLLSRSYQSADSLLDLKLRAFARRSGMETLAVIDFLDAFRLRVEYWV